MMFRKIPFFIVTLLFCVVSVKAQQQDLRTWWSAELEGELVDLIDFSITPELRLENNSSSFDAALFELDLSVPLTKFFRVGTEYRFKLEQQEEQYQNINRFGIYGELDYSIKRVKLDYRAMYLAEFTDMNTSINGRIPETLHRHRIKVRYRKKGSDFTESLAFESFYTLQPLSNKNRVKIRATASVQYRVNKDFNIQLSYKYQQEYLERNPLTSHIISLGIEYEL